jgi:TatD DNase family protein
VVVSHCAIDAFDLSHINFTLSAIIFSSPTSPHFNSIHLANQSSNSFVSNLKMSPPPNESASSNGAEQRGKYNFKPAAAVTNSTGNNINGKIQSQSGVNTSRVVENYWAERVRNMNLNASLTPEPIKTTPLTDETMNGADVSDKPASTTEIPLPIRPIFDANGVMTPLIDIGANLTKKYFPAEEIPSILRRASEAGLTHIIITGTSYSTSDYALQLCERFDGTEGITLRCTIGIHPGSAHETLVKKDGTPGTYARTFHTDLERLIVSRRGQKYCVAIGECGLDYHGASFSKDVALHQRQVFRKQLALAEKHQLPVFMHSRDSHKDFMEILRLYLATVKGVVHCHTDPSVDHLKELLNYGLYIGLTGIICDKRQGRFNTDIICEIPWDRLMVETDSPFLFPGNTGKSFGKRNNEPCMTSFVVKKIAQVSGDCTESEVASRTTKVAKEFFGLS